MSENKGQFLRLSAKEIYGYEYNYADSISESSTTSTSWQQKLGLQTPSVPAGTYRISYTAELKNLGPPGPSCAASFLIDGSVYSDGVNDKPDWEISTSFTHLTFDASNTHEIKIQWRSLPGRTAFIRRARIEFWRVS